MDTTDTDEAVPDGLTKLTVYLTSRSREALYLAAELTELSKTDTVNRALQCYAAITEAAAEGKPIRLTADLLGDDSWQDLFVQPTELAARPWWRWFR